LDSLQKFLPVLVYGRLAVADEANAAFHERANVEVVGAVIIGQYGDSMEE
jgi:hypothetical protein